MICFFFKIIFITFINTIVSLLQQQKSEIIYLRNVVISEISNIPLLAGILIIWVM